MKKTMEKTITMSLSEFDKLNAENKSMKEILKNKGVIGLEFISDNMGMGYIRNSWNITTKDEIVTKLLDYIKELQSEKSEINKRLYDLKTTQEFKKSRNWFGN